MKLSLLISQTELESSPVQPLLSHRRLYKQSLFRRLPFWRALLLLAPLAAALCGCSHSAGKNEEILYVTAPQAILRDRVAPVYSKTGTVHNGDKVTVLEHGRRWERVRNAQGEQGWLQDRFLVGEDVFRAFQQLRSEHEDDPAQAHGVLRNDFRLHIQPGRQTDRLFLMKEGQRLDLLQRVSVPKSGSAAPLRATVPAISTTDAQDAKDAARDEETEYKGEDKPEQSTGSASRKTRTALKHPPVSKEPTPPVPMEDWWLVRDRKGHAGWVPGRELDRDVPLDVAQYAEGQRIVAFFPLTSVHDSELNKDEPYYLVLLTEPKDGLPFDYNQIRVFSWNLKRHRYETAYRERNIYGMLPVSVGHEQFENEGPLPTFTIHVRDEAGSTVPVKFKLEGVMVRRVLAPGEEEVKIAHPSPERPKPRRQ